MATKKAGALLPNAAERQSGPDYLRGLIDKAGVSQRAAARQLGVDERTMRYYLSGHTPAPYPVQFCLEVLAAGGAGAGSRVADAPRPQAWVQTSARRLSADDSGRLVVARGRAGVYYVGRVKADGFGVVLEPLFGLSVDGGDVGAGLVEEYVLLEEPNAY